MNKLTFTDHLAITCDWFFEEYDMETGALVYQSGPMRNDISPEGLIWAASGIAAMPSPYLLIGDDLADGFVITEVHRQMVDYVLQVGPQSRFRTIVIPGVATGNHNKASLFYGATDTPGTGTMFNLLKQPYSHASNTVLTVEARVNMAQGTGV